MVNKSKELTNTTKLVKTILERDKATRNSDNLLYLKVLETIATEKDDPVSLQSMSVPYFLLNMAGFKFPCFETVRRTRQKIQATYPELKACEDVEQFRDQNEEAFRDYARGVV